MTETKSLKIKLSSWNKLRRAFYGRKNETFSDYIERIALALEHKKTFIIKNGKVGIGKELKNE